jgi:hypothetical protein
MPTPSTTQTNASNSERVGSAAVTGDRSGCRKMTSATGGSTPVTFSCWNVRGWYGDCNSAKRAIVVDECLKKGVAACGVTELKGSDLSDSSNVRYCDFSGTQMRLISTRHCGIIIDTKILHLISAGSACGGRAVWARISVSKTLSLLLISVYAWTAKDVGKSEKLYEELSDLISAQRLSKIIMLGDFNARTGVDDANGCLGKYRFGTKNPNTEHLLEFATREQFAITPSFFSMKWSRRSTWWHASSRKWFEIDYVLVPKTMLSSVCSYYADNRAVKISDHKPVYCVIKLRLYRKQRQPKEPLARIRCSDTALEDVNRFQTALNHTRVLENTDVDEANKALTSTLNEAAKLLPGTKMQYQKSYLSQEFFAKADEARRSSGACRRRLRREAFRIERRDKRIWLHAACNQATEDFNRGRSFRFFDQLKGIIRGAAASRERIREDAHLIVNGNVITDPKLKCEAHAENLAKKFTSDCPIEPPLENVLHVACPPISTSPPSAEEVAKAISKCKCGKSSGTDNVSDDIIKLSGDCGVAMFVHVFRLVFEAMKMPSKWLEVSVTIVGKPGRDKSLLSSYRPISLIQCSLKLLEGVIADRLVDWWEGVIGYMQCGFLRSRQMAENIVALKALAAHASAQGRSCFVAYLDLQSAYDLVDRSILFSCLERKGCPQLLLEIIKAMYSGNNFFVKDRNCKSEPKLTSRGLLQGSRLSPALFNILLSCIFEDAKAKMDLAGIQCGAKRIMTTPRQITLEPTASSHGYNLRNRSASNQAPCTFTWPPYGNVVDFVFFWALMYADDICVIADTKAQLATMMTFIYDSFKSFRVVLNVEKSFWQSLGYDCDDRAPLLIRSSDSYCELSFCEKFVYLGSTIHSGKACTDDAPHLAARIAKAETRMWQLLPVLRSNQLSTSLKMKMIDAFVNPVALCGIEACCISSKMLKKLRGFEWRCLKRVGRVKYAEHITWQDLRLRCGATKKLEETALTRRSMFIGHLLRHPSLPASQALRCSYDCLTKNRKRRGRRFTVLHDIHKCCKSITADPNNRTAWKEAAMVASKAAVENADSKRFSCRSCGKKFKTKGWLEKHEKCHDLNL